MKPSPKWFVIIGIFIAALLVVISINDGNQATAKEKALKSDVKMRMINDAIMSVPKDQADKDKTLSPYFFVMSDNPEVDKLPLKTTRADVTISGVIADVKVTQVYKNTGKSTLEAIYIFPASTKAAVYSMRMTIGKRVIEAKIKERAKARQEYEQAKQEGKTASLLEQQRPNVFQMNVANILPGDNVKVELNYTELLVPTDKIYSFVYPTVVGPRYSNVKEEKAPETEKWVKNPYLREGEDATYTFGLDVQINSGVPIAGLTCPSHEVKVEYAGKSAASIAIPESTKAGNRDFVLKYSLVGKQIESGLLLYPGKDENFFLAMMEPPKRVITKKIVPREYIFIIDISGSMRGFPLSITKELMRDLFSNLRSNDYFNVLLFAGGNAVLSEKSLPANKANIEKAINVVDNQRGGGGTELIPAMKRALALPRAEENISRIVVIATDGYVAVEKDTFELIRSNLGNANLFSFGIGSSVNRFLIEGMARAGMGEPFIILKPEGAKEKAEKLRDYISSPVLQGIKVGFDGFSAYDTEPKSIPDLFALKPVIIFGKYKGDPKGSMTIFGRLPDGEFKKTLEIKDANISEKNAALRYLWARHRVFDKADMAKLSHDNDAIKEVTELGLKYNLLTEYTSFVAIDTEVRANGEKSVTVKQPLPLPQGVSDSAVGGGKRGRAMPMHKTYGVPSPAREMLAVDEEADKGINVAKFGVNNIDIKLKTGSIDLLKAKRLVGRYIPQFNKCYKNALKNKKSLSGKFSFELTLDAKGKVTKAKLLKSDVLCVKFMACLEKQLKSLKFGAPDNKSRAIIEVHLTFAK